MDKSTLDKAVADGVITAVALVDGKAPEGDKSDVGFSTDEVTTTVKLQDGKTREEKRPYLKLTALTLKGATFLSESKADVLLGHFNYAYDLGARNRERQALLATLEGPEKAIERGVKGLVAAGIPESVARGIVIEQRKIAGLPV
jgi:hypothetical protein